MSYSQKYGSIFEENVYTPCFCPQLLFFYSFILLCNEIICSKPLSELTPTEDRGKNETLRVVSPVSVCSP